MKNKTLNLIGIIIVVLAVMLAYFLKQEHVMNIGIKTENMDTTIRPGDNFYDYTTLEWRRANPIPDDFTRYGVFDVLHDKNLERVHQIAQNDSGKIGILYKVAMNTERLNQERTSPVAPQLAEIDAIKSVTDLPNYLGRIHRITSAFWSDGVALDEKDSGHFLYNIAQGGLGLARDYYFDTDAKSIEVRIKYKQFIEKQMNNFGIRVDASKLYALEERMAKSFSPKETLRDPLANYHKKTIAEIRQEFPDFDWDTYLASRGASTASHINIGQPDALRESIAIMNDTDIELIKTYLKYRIISVSDTFLDDETYNLTFDFYNRTMADQQQPKPRWKRVIGLLNGSLGEEIGRLYVEKYFSATSKSRMEKLVKNLQRALGMRIKNLDWMSDTTKQHALEKLSTFRAKIGYPEKWRDYSLLKISADLSLWENVINIFEFEDKFWLDKIGKEKDSTLWYMNAHEINAYYDPSTNEICFPAGILQPPFFDADADDAFNYGAIGSIIGHEMTHGYDDSGRHFDKDGNMKDWWTEQDVTRFNTRTKVLVDYFDKIMITPDIHANGTFTIGENLADYGGITVSYTAYKQFGTPSETFDGLTSDMRFFIAYASVWAGNIREAEMLRRTKIDEHSLNQNRVNGILPHIDAWYDAFNIDNTSRLYIAPADRIKLW